MKKSIALILLVALLSVSLVACGGGDSIIGSWVYNEEEGGMTYEITMNFKDGGTGEMSIGSLATMEFTYSIDGDKLTIKTEGEDPDIGTYKIEGDKMTVTDGEGEIIVLTRKK